MLFTVLFVVLVVRASYKDRDEKREAMGYDDYKPTGTPGGTILVPSANIPLELAGQIDLPEPGSEADKKPDEEEDDGLLPGGRPLAEPVAPVAEATPDEIAAELAREAAEKEEPATA